MSKFELPQFNCCRISADGVLEAVWLYTYVGVLAWIQQQPHLNVAVYHEGTRIPYNQLKADGAQVNTAAKEIDERDALILAGGLGTKRGSED